MSMAKLKKFTDQQLQELVANSTSWRQLCIALNMLGGSAHRAVVARIKTLGIDTSHFTGKCWNKGLTKETHPSLAKGAETYKRTQTGRPGRPHTIETRQKMSRSSSERSWSNGVVRTKWFHVMNPFTSDLVSVQGNWEKLYAEYLNTSGIKWEKTKKKSFTWTRGGNDIFHSYHPDFYLPDSDTYVEIKGYMWKSKDGRIDDELKLRLVQEQNPEMKLVILMEEDLKTLGILK